MTDENKSQTSSPPPENKRSDVPNNSPAVTALQQHMAKWYSRAPRAGGTESYIDDSSFYCAVEGSD